MLYGLVSRFLLPLTPLLFSLSLESSVGKVSVQ